MLIHLASEHHWDTVEHFIEHLSTYLPYDKENEPEFRSTSLRYGSEGWLAGKVWKVFGFPINDL